ncbi:uncharacterized protein LOC142645179 [Dermatophagoides pteronyssinus]|uniref:uncharacterized protein LOC142645179 n=1 Tax=Dermatophagoides pteronyssinus TaxID=6956 RepID=UPI003F6725BA
MTSVEIVAIIVLIITLLIQTTFETDGDLWFPKEFPNDKLVKCGLDHEMYGLSIVDDYIFQFDKCSVIIYPPPIDKYLNKNLTELNLENGYHYQFNEIQPNWWPSYCEQAKRSIITPQYVLIRLNVPNKEYNNHIFIYFTGLLSQNETNLYYIHDFDTRLGEEKNSYQYKRPLTKFIFINNGYEIFFIENENSEYEFELNKDRFIGKDSVYMGTVCIDNKTNINAYEYYNHYNNSNNNNQHDIYRRIPQICEPDSIRNYTHSLFEYIDSSFTYNGKLFFISTEKQFILKTDIEFLDLGNEHKVFPAERITFSKFFTCKTKPTIKSTTLQQSNITLITTTMMTIITTTESYLDNNLLIIIIIIIIISIIIICILIGIFIYFKQKKKLKDTVETSSEESASLTKSKSIIPETTTNLQLTLTTTTTTSKLPPTPTTATSKLTPPYPPPPPTSKLQPTISKSKSNIIPLKSRSKIIPFFIKSILSRKAPSKITPVLSKTTKSPEATSKITPVSPLSRKETSKIIRPLSWKETSKIIRPLSWKETSKIIRPLSWKATTKITPVSPLSWKATSKITAPLSRKAISKITAPLSRKAISKITAPTTTTTSSSKTESVSTSRSKSLSSDVLRKKKQKDLHMDTVRSSFDPMNHFKHIPKKSKKNKYYPRI